MTQILFIVEGGFAGVAFEFYIPEESLVGFVQAVERFEVVGLADWAHLLLHHIDLAGTEHILAARTLAGLHCQAQANMARKNFEDFFRELGLELGEVYINLGIVHCIIIFEPFWRFNNFGTQSTYNNKTQQMFFGFIVGPGKSYKFSDDEIQKGDVLNITNSVLTAQGKKTDLYVKVKGEDFIVARLNDHVPQVNLDLHFSILDEAEIFVKDGASQVHLVGFYENEVDEDMDMEDEEAADEESQEEDQQVPVKKAEPKKQVESTKQAAPVQKPQQQQQHAVAKQAQKPAQAAPAPAAPKQEAQKQAQKVGSPKAAPKPSEAVPAKKLQQKKPAQDDEDEDEDDDLVGEEDEEDEEGDEEEDDDEEGEEEEDEDEEDEEEVEIDDEIDADEEDEEDVPRKQTKGNDGKAAKPQQQQQKPPQQQHKPQGQQQKPHQQQHQQKQGGQGGQGGKPHQQQQQHKGGQQKPQGGNFQKNPQQGGNPQKQHKQKH